MNLEIKKIKRLNRNKSDIFLYPLLNIPTKKSVGKINCYTEIEGVYKKRHCMLALEVGSEYDTLSITKHKNYVRSINICNKTYYIFNLRDFKRDVALFHKGKYSELSERCKRSILKYYQGAFMYKYIRSWLYPKEYYDNYAQLFGVSKEEIEQAVELSSPPVLKDEEISYIC